MPVYLKLRKPFTCESQCAESSQIELFRCVEHRASIGELWTSDNFICALMAEEANPELETFRKQWQEEVTARSKISSFTKKNERSYGPPKREIENNKSHQNTVPSASIRLDQFEEESFDGAGGDGYHDLEDKDVRRRLGEAGEGVHPSNENDREPSSALEHYEKAVERESQGNLGDSLKLYRKAYRVRMLLKSGKGIIH